MVPATKPLYTRGFRIERVLGDRMDDHRTVLVRFLKRTTLA